MTKIIMSGCNGKMGQVISRLVEEDDDAEIVCGVDLNTEQLNGYPVVKSIDEFDGDADVVIDFSHPSCLTGLLSYCRKKNMPVILATTGYTAEQKKEFTECLIRDTAFLLCKHESWNKSSYFTRKAGCKTA